jgi:1-acyl-sn-glycerol-3-phosphate acyltransferase
MHYCFDFLTILRRFVGFLAYRWGLATQRPSFIPVLPQLVHSAGPFFRWPRHFRLLEDHYCPTEGPALFAANHVDVWDSAYTVNAVVSGSGTRLAPCSMMRDDFFRSADDSTNTPRQLAWGDDIIEAMGGIRITRGKPQLSQLRPLLTLLDEGGAFIMYPNGTRTRSGMFFEYRDDVKEPGAVSFFLAHAQRRRGEPVPAVPLVRTVNLVERSNTLIFGRPQYLPLDNDRQSQRAFDRRLAVTMSDLVEVNVPQVACALLYLRALHHQPAHLLKEELTSMLREVFRRLTHPYIAPAVGQDLAGALTMTLAYLRRHGLVEMHGKSLQLLPEQWLGPPPADGRYRNHSPARYMINQITHLEQVIKPIQEVVLEYQPISNPNTRRA